MNIPVHFYATTENKFTVLLDDAKNEKINGKHYINTYYTLVSGYFADGKTWKMKTNTGKYWRRHGK
jgi:hypothetical protein